MQLELIRNGYHLQRKKLYPTNPRNNLISTVDMLWRQSLQDQSYLSTKKIQNKKVQQTEFIKHQYNRLLQRQIQEQMKLDKSSFRVIPVQRQYNRYDDRYANKEIYKGNNLLTSRRSSMNVRDFQIDKKGSFYQQKQLYESNNKNFTSSKQILKPTTVDYGGSISPLKSSGLLSKTVFGYQINPQNFKRESYLSKVLTDRLSPYLQHSNQNCRRHKSVSVNNIVNLNY